MGSLCFLNYCDSELEVERKAKQMGTLFGVVLNFRDLIAYLYKTPMASIIFTPPLFTSRTLDFQLYLQID